MDKYLAFDVQATQGRHGTVITGDAHVSHALAGLDAYAVTYHFIIHPQGAVEKYQLGTADTVRQLVCHPGTGRHIEEFRTAPAVFYFQGNGVLVYGTEILSLAGVLQPQGNLARHGKRCNAQTGSGPIRLLQLHQLLQVQRLARHEFRVKDVEDGIRGQHFQHPPGGVDTQGL